LNQLSAVQEGAIIAMETDNNVLYLDENTKVQRLLHHINSLQNVHSEAQLSDSLSMIRAILNGPHGLQLLAKQEVFPFVYVGLSHPEVDVRFLTLSLLIGCAEVPNIVPQVVDPLLLNAVFANLSSEELSLAQKASQFFQTLGSHPEGLKTVFQNNFISQFLKLLDSGTETIKFRVLDLFASLGALSPEAFQLVESTGLLEKIVKTLDSDDILGKLNTIEILEKMSSSPEGVSYLERAQVLSKLRDLLLAKDGFSSFLVPKVIHFFGELGAKGGDALALLSKYRILPELIKKLDRHSVPKDVLESTLTTIGQIGATVEGIRLLESSGALRPFLSLVTLHGDMRMTSFHSLAFLLKNLSKTASDQEMDIVHNALTTIQTETGRNSVNNIVLPVLVSQPFPDMRYAAFDVVAGLASYRKGVEVMLMPYPGFYEFITNRNTENTKEGKEWKYTIIQTMMKTAERSPDIIPKQKQNELTRYLNNGVFYVASEATMEVATQDTV